MYYFINNYKINAKEKGLLHHYTALFSDPCSVMMGSSPRFNMYGNEFEMGKTVALRSGYANKFDGTVTSYPGYDGGGSIDLEIGGVPFARFNERS